MAFVCPNLKVGGGTVFIINLASELMRRGVLCHVVSLGDIQTLMEGDGRQTVRFAGVTPYSEVPALLASHDVFLLTSDTESFCLNLHVPPDNIDGYADAIVWLHRHRDELAKRSATAQESIRHFHSAGAMAERWLSLLSRKPVVPVAWPKRWRVGAPLDTPPPRMRFTPPGRLLRRLMARCRRNSPA